jgi:acyl carrier protein
MTDQEKIKFIEDSLLEMLDRKLNVKPTDVLVDDLNLDSLDIVELQMNYEEKTGKEIPDDLVVVTVQDLMNAME